MASYQKHPGWLMEPSRLSPELKQQRSWVLMNKDITRWHKTPGLPPHHSHKGRRVSCLDDNTTVSASRDEIPEQKRGSSKPIPPSSAAQK